MIFESVIMMITVTSDTEFQVQGVNLKSAAARVTSHFRGPGPAAAAAPCRGPRHGVTSRRSHRDLAVTVNRYLTQSRSCRAPDRAPLCRRQCSEPSHWQPPRPGLSGTVTVAAAAAAAVAAGAAASTTRPPRPEAALAVPALTEAAGCRAAGRHGRWPGAQSLQSF